MPRLTLSLPEELGTAHSGSERSPILDSGVEGPDELARQVDRWLSCWATGED